MMTFKELFEYRDLEDEYWNDRRSLCYRHNAPLRYLINHKNYHSIFDRYYLIRVIDILPRPKKPNNCLTPLEEMFNYWLGAWFYSHSNH